MKHGFRRAGNGTLQLRLGRLTIGQPHRARHWWEGICIEWQHPIAPGCYVGPVSFFRVYVQLAKPVREAASRISIRRGKWRGEEDNELL